MKLHNHKHLKVEEEKTISASTDIDWLNFESTLNLGLEVEVGWGRPEPAYLYLQVA